MYYYIVDPQKLSQREFERVQNLLYSSLSEFRISGEVVRVTGLRTVLQLVENAFAHEAKTIVAVGSDETLHEVINAIGKREMVVGFIPISSSEIADIFGIKDIVHAVKTIAFRRIELIDLGIVNNNYFLSKISFGIDHEQGLRSLLNLPKYEIKFSADEKYQANQTVVAALIVDHKKTDGLLDVLLLPPLSKWQTIIHRRQILNGNFEKISQASVLHVKKIEIVEPTGLPLKIESRVITRTPAIITVAPAQLRMIVGKDRKF